MLLLTIYLDYSFSNKLTQYSSNLYCWNNSKNIIKHVELELRYLKIKIFILIFMDYLFLIQVMLFHPINTINQNNQHFFICIFYEFLDHKIIVDSLLVLLMVNFNFSFNFIDLVFFLLNFFEDP